MNKCSVVGGMRVRAYEVFHRAIEEGISLGYRRAHKYTETPSEEMFREAIENAILETVLEYFTFYDDLSEE